jgi:deoxyribonuclease V
VKGSAGSVPAFNAGVEAALAQVPRGRVTTYGDVARALGDVRAARAVGALLAENDRPAQVPCHRVVMADGGLGGYAFGGTPAKARALRGEGVVVRGGRVVGLDGVAVRAFDVVPVLSMLATRQREMARQVNLTRADPEPVVVIGVDAAYAGKGAVAAACAFDLRTQRPLAQAAVPFTPGLPYVPGYLAFRELEGLVAAVRALPAAHLARAVVMVDGQGILHPRRCGIASMVGLVLGVSSIGTAKKRLVGEVGPRAQALEGHDAYPVRVGRERRGALLARRGGARGVFVSPGTGLSLSQAISLAARATQPGARSPWPVAAADRACRKAAAAQ